MAGALVADYRASRKRMPGYGHRIHKVDPRTRKLYELAEEVRFAGRHMALAKAI